MRHLRRPIIREYMRTFRNKSANTLRLASASRGEQKALSRQIEIFTLQALEPLERALARPAEAAGAKVFKTV